MEPLFIYMAKSSGLIVLFYCAYYFLLRKETFFNSNRWFLLVGLITSIALPFFVYTKIIWVNPAPITNLNLSQLNIIQTPENKSFKINWTYIFLIIYSIGFIAMLIKFAIDFYSLHAILKEKKIQQQADYKFIDVSQNISPFSYFQNIVYNSSMYTESELKNILEHEKVHSDQNHTVDVLISRFFCILFWFNPIIWFYKKAILQNLEFIADKEAAKKISDKRAYQYTLLKITTHENCVAITNHFYQSLIKKRIVMLNKNQSKKRNSWKYYAILPTLVAFILLFQVETIAQEKTSDSIEKINSHEIKSIDVITIEKNTTDADIDKRVKTLKEKFNISTTISELERNSNNEITAIQVELKDKNNVPKVKKEVSGKGIEKIGITIITEKDGKVSFNFNEMKISKGSSEEITLKVKSNQNSNSNSDVKIISTNANVSTIVNTNTNLKTKQLIIVDGKEYPENTSIDELKPLSIDKMDVFKGEDAIVKYGKKAKDGVIVITTKKDSPWAMSFGLSDQSETIQRIKENKNIDYKKAIIVIDGKVSDYSELDKINPNHVKSVTSPAVKNFPEALKKKMLDKYGEKALNGIVEIETDSSMEN